MANYNPTGLYLPSLVYDGLTRTGNESILYFNLTPARKLGMAGVDAAGDEIWTPEQSCGNLEALPASNIGVIRARRPIKSSTQSEWGIFGANKGILPAYAPPDQGAEIGTIASLNTISQSTVEAAGIVGAEPGDSVDVIALPHRSGNILLCYDQGITTDPGTEDKPIPRKFVNADHYVLQRGERTMQVRDMYVNNLEGLASIRNRSVTLIEEIYPSGSSIPSEVTYYTNVRLKIPREVGQDGNESVVVNAEGNYGERIVFTARRS